MPSGPRPRAAGGLDGLRRGSTLGDLLFLIDCATEEPTRLRPIAQRLRVTVQAASHTYRTLARRGLVELRDGRYRPTVRGVAWLLRTLGAFSDDVFNRQRRLPIVRSLRAVAGVGLRPGDPVVLELVDGTLTARPGRGTGSRGIVRVGGRSGDLVEVGELEGILPIAPAQIVVLTVRAADLSRAGLVPAVTRAIADAPQGILAARGLEAFHVASRAVRGPIARFGAGSIATEAARIGVPATVIVLEEELARFLDELPVVDRPSLSVRSVSPGRSSGKLVE